MTNKLEECPAWVSSALQGITYWIGHRRCLYRHYPLSEGALVAEICNLVHANLDDKSVLECEVQYSKIVPEKSKSQELAGRIRADLVVARKVNHRESFHPQFVIEVKRYAAPTSQIDADIRRLAAAKRIRPDIRTFLFVISEAQRPDRFVDNEGKSKRGRFQLEDGLGYFRVRRTWKAAHAYTKRERAQYACLIEVYPQFD